jgi:tetratricopeptide (TPR) repeat protein
MYWVVGLRPWNAAMIAGAAIYLLWSRLSKAVALRHQRAGVRLLRAGDFESAAAAFTKSFESLSRRPWIDQYRFLVLQDSSAISYREMALANAAFAHLRGGDTKRALSAHRAALDAFPQSQLALDGKAECERLLEENGKL